MQFLSIWCVGYALLGLVSGFLAGLLGIGGGLIIVAVLTMMFAAQGFDHAIILPLALGTSMATIVFTSISSMRAHHRHQAVRWDLVRDISPGVVVGAVFGTHIAAAMPARSLAIFFALFVVVIALQMGLNLKPKAQRELPGLIGRVGVGAIIGTVSALVAIGGGSLTVPWLTWCNVRIQNAIGTSAAMGLPIALAGTAGYLWNGWNQASLPAASLGYVYLPSLLWLLIASMLTAPLGARTAHRLPVAILKRIFSILLVILAAKMLWSVWQNTP